MRCEGHDMGDARFASEGAPDSGRIGPPSTPCAAASLGRRPSAGVPRPPPFGSAGKGPATHQSALSLASTLPMERLTPVVSHLMEDSGSEMLVAWMLLSVKSTWRASGRRARAAEPADDARSKGRKMEGERGASTRLRLRNRSQGCFFAFCSASARGKKRPAALMQRTLSFG